MSVGQTRPLHRLTQLRDDPASKWLSWRQRIQVAGVGALAWCAYAACLMLFRLILLIVLEQAVHYAGRLPSAISAMVAAGLAIPMRRFILTLKSRRAATLVRGNSRDVHALDDWAELETEPDGRVVSVVGWIRSRLDVEYPVNGEPCIGLALPCQDTYPGVLETLHDFELTDESGGSIPIRVADGRMLGRPNVRLNSDSTRRLLIASLDLPPGAVATNMEAFVLRDGDPVMIVGFKQTIRDPEVYEARQTCLRAAIGSAPTQPLLIFPLAAERRIRGVAEQSQNKP